MGHRLARIHADRFLVRAAKVSKSATRLLLLPGLDGTGELFAPFLRVWPPDPQPLVVDYPRDRFLNYAGCLDHVFERLAGDEDFIVVAESFSGPVGIALAARAPERVKALILCATFASAPRDGILNSLIRIFAPVTFNFPAPRFVVHQFLLNGDRDPELLLRVCKNKSRVSARVMAERLRLVMSCDVREDLRRVQCPVLYLQAARDRLIDPSAGNKIREIQPAMKIVRIDAPHFILQSKPADAARAISSFIGETIRPGIT